MNFIKPKKSLLTSLYKGRNYTNIFIIASSLKFLIYRLPKKILLGKIKKVPMVQNLQVNYVIIILLLWKPMPKDVKNLLEGTEQV